MREPCATRRHYAHCRYVSMEILFLFYFQNKGERCQKGCGSRTCKPNSVPGLHRVTVIPLGRSSLNGSSDLPGSVARRAGTRPGEPGLLPYLVLLRVGFALPRSLLNGRCALTAPFHPYRLSEENRRYVFCGTFRRLSLNSGSRTLSGTLLCGVRTFLYRAEARQRPSGPATNALIILDEGRGGSV